MAKSKPNRQPKPKRARKPSTPPATKSRGRSPQTLAERLISVGLVGVVALAIGLHTFDSKMVSQADPSSPALAVPSRQADAETAISEGSSEPAGGRAKPIRAPVLGQAPDAATTQLIKDGLKSALDAFPKGKGTGVALIDPSGRVVTGINEEVPMMPASTIKVATGAALWNTFGPDHG